MIRKFLDWLRSRREEQARIEYHKGYEHARLELVKSQRSPRRLQSVIDEANGFYDNGFDMDADSHWNRGMRDAISDWHAVEPLVGVTL